jgi:uncharacterized membrane protein YphA (DoxX/SURF4 family)
VRGLAGEDGSIGAGESVYYIRTLPMIPPSYRLPRMPSRDLVRAFLLLYLVTGMVVLFQSLQTVWAAHLGAIRPPDRIHAMILGSLEAVAAVLFLIPRTMRLGAVGLLAVFVTAFALHATHGGPDLGLMIYAAVVLFIRVHGVQPSYFTHLRA